MLVGLIAALAVSTAVPQLINPDFEAPDLGPAWQTHVYNDARAPVIRPDATVAHAGRQALLVEAADPADVAIAQGVKLPPGEIWRARCWIRTHDLKTTNGADVGGALHIQDSAGGTLARSDSRFGTTDWRDADVLFRVPPDGGVKIVLFFIGYGRGTGRAWFDDVRLEPAPTQEPPRMEIDITRRAPLSLDPARPGPAAIDVKQGGQFLEPLCGMLPAAIAQQVANDSFEDE
ncbi:MAG: hypothetical protein AB1716_24675, partial [Planctomycetota bacterium]